MRRVILTLLAVSFCSVAYAVDLGRAQGAMIVDGSRVDLNYAYAINHQKNEVTHRSDDTRVVLTAKPLPPDVNLADIDDSFPEGILGMVISVSSDDKVSHIVVQHARGMYDGGFFAEEPSYTFKRLNSTDGSIAGTVSATKVKTNTMTFWFNVDFAAMPK